MFLTAAYTWQHSLSDTRGYLFFENATGIQDVYHPGNDYGSSHINVPQVFTVSAVWNPPWYRHSCGIQELALGGWQFSDITTVPSGFSEDPALSISNPGLAIRPDKAPGTSISGPKTVNEWFNTGAFTAPAYGYFGNAGPGPILGPGTINFDMALYKDFHLGKHVTTQLRGEFFNAFNHSNFNGISTSLGSGAFGRVVGAADPRIIELALQQEEQVPGAGCRGPEEQVPGVGFQVSHAGPGDWGLGAGDGSSCQVSEERVSTMRGARRQEQEDNSQCGIRH